jgi:dienelactone hydrolase
MRVTGQFSSVFMVLLWACSFAHGAPEDVTFEVREPNAASVALTGVLTKPPGTGRFPAVVLLHGCGGMNPSWGDVWAKRFNGWGYVTLQVDSFTSRGDVFASLEEASAACARNETASTWTRAYDAHAAKAYLGNLPFVDAGRVAVFGQSDGGDAILWAVTNHPRYIAEGRDTVPFAAAIALYPWCHRTLYNLEAPLLVLIGQLDNSTPANRCKRMKLEGDTTHSLRLKVYPGAHHVFDVDAPERVVVGQTMAYDAMATADAIEQVKGFLEEHFQ